jgi:hypothetical protein
MVSPRLELVSSPGEAVGSILLLESELGAHSHLPNRLSLVHAWVCANAGGRLGVRAEQVRRLQGRQRGSVCQGCASVEPLLPELLEALAAGGRLIEIA